MGGPLDTWHVRGWFDDVEVEINPRSFDPEDARRSRGELALMLEGLGHLPEARLILLEVHERLIGVSVRGLPEDETRTLLAGLENAATLGLLVVRRLERRGPLASGAPETQAPKLRLLPEPPPGPQKSWIGVLLIDQDGTPVPDRGYRIVDFDGNDYEGTLDAAGTAKVTDLDDGPCRVSCPYLATRGSLTHTVEPGEHISGIAESYGFDDYAVVWNDPQNAELQAQRSNPHELVAGDQVFVPAWKDLPVSKPTGDQYTFSIKRSPLKLRVKVLSLSMNPLAGASCTLDQAQLATDGGGIVEEPVDKSARAAFLNVQGVDLALQIGRLAPPDDDSDAGWKARLFNLGFLLDPEAEDGDEELRIALQDFQAQYQLPVTGAFDDATKAQLQQVYGC